MGEKPRSPKLSKGELDAELESTMQRLRDSDARLWAAARKLGFRKPSKRELDAASARILAQMADSPKPEHQLAAQLLGSLGGQKRMSALSNRERQALASKAGKARAKKLSAAKRKAIAKAAVAARERKRAERRAKP